MTLSCTLFELKNVMKALTCYKNTENPSCIDIFLTNCCRRFHNTYFYETSLYNFCKLVEAILRLSFEPLPPIIIKYKNYRRFDEIPIKFRCLFKRRLNEFNTDVITVDTLNMTFLDVLNTSASLKKKYLGANHSRLVKKNNVIR